MSTSEGRSRVATLLLLGLFAVLSILLMFGGTGTDKPRPQVAVQDPVAAFLASHWSRPLRPQGAPPAHFSGLEASLDPATCGACHQAQYDDWRHSLHSQTMTAGVLWQFRLMPQAEANACMDCHAPLAEQKALVAQAHGWAAAPDSPPPDYVPASLGHEGLVCAACHVREHARFGPPKADGSPPWMAGPHEGFTPSEAFQDSRFCAACHQFPDDGPRTAGKLREDTYRQWLDSEFAVRGETCQSCHMPDRRHVWQGIHSPEMVRRALSTDLRLEAGEVSALLTNIGAGHYFPTYMVPKVTAQLVLGDGSETVLAETVIGWHVDVFLEDEFFDTRLPPGGSVSLRAPLPEGVDAAQVELRLQVAPREHYERTYLSVLDQAALLDADTLSLLRQAYDEAVATRFEALRVPLTTAPRPDIPPSASAVEQTP